jgi:hypothetical protein
MVASVANMLVRSWALLNYEVMKPKHFLRQKKNSEEYSS